MSAVGEGYDNARAAVGVIFELGVGDGGGWDGVLGWDADNQPDETLWCVVWLESSR